MEKYFHYAQFYADIMPYNHWITVAHWIWSIFVTLSWSYLDVFIIICCRFLALQFRTISRIIQRHQHEQGHATVTDLDHFLRKVHKQYLTIAKVVDDFNSAFSPLLMSLFCGNLVCFSIWVSRVALVTIDKPQ